MILSRKHQTMTLEHEKKRSLGLVMILLTLMSLPASAQQADHPKVDTYRQLLSEANDRLAGMAAQVQQLQTQVQQLQAELAKTKTPKEELKK
jgi:conjugal transfer/entry exclusion protein